MNSELLAEVIRGDIRIALYDSAYNGRQEYIVYGEKGGEPFFKGFYGGSRHNATRGYHILQVSQFGEIVDRNGQER